MARNERETSLGEEYERFVRDQIRSVIREELQEALRNINLQNADDQGEQDNGGEEFDEDIQREAEEEGIPPSQTRAYHRMKSRETRDRHGGSQGTRGSKGSSSGQRGQVTNPDQDRRLKGNRDAA